MNTVEFKDIKFHIQHETLFNSRSCGKFKIIEYKKAAEVTVEFEDTGYTKIVQIGSIRLGKVKDRLKPSYYGVGILGDKYGCQVDGKIIKEHLIWNLMLSRCYSKDRLKNVNYNDCFVSENFKYYPYFYEWCNKQVGFNSEGFELDKDLLFKGNREYGEDTCVFIPREVNVMLTKSDKTRGDLPIGVHFDKHKGKYIAQMCKGSGSSSRFLGRFEDSKEAFTCYKINKEVYAKELAAKWKDAIDPRAYDALMNYEVDIDD